MRDRGLFYFERNVMKFITDHMYKIGASHTRCEDYALSGIIEGVPYAVVCDGCSSSPGDVTTGSRILAMGVRNAVKEIASQNKIGPNDYMYIPHILRNFVRDAIVNAMNNLDMGLDDFLCTIQLVLIVNGTIYDWSFGDGVHFRRSGNADQLDCVDVEFSSNAPYYPVYDMFYTYEYSRESYESYFKNHPVYYRKNFERHDFDHCKFTDVLVDKFLVWSYRTRPLSDETLVGVTSDGAKSFSQDKIPCETQDIIDEMSNIKIRDGVFLNRRMNKFLKKPGLSHYDDVSVAAILIDREEK
jgi:hypothetical protein